MGESGDDFIYNLQKHGYQRRKPMCQWELIEKFSQVIL